jgi:hypothetical protein
MLGPVDYSLWLLTFLAEACCVVCLLKKKALPQHFTIILYLLATMGTTVSRYAVLKTAGYASNSYVYTYYYSDALLTICLYFILISLYSHVFSEIGVSKMVRAGAMLLLAGTALISFRMVASSTDRLVTNFVFELSQNLNFVGVVLTYVLWGAMMKLRENRTRLTQLLLSLGVYFSAFAGSYALGNMYPDLGIWRYVCHLMEMWLPISWAYTFLKVPEDARIATQSVMASTQ